MANHKHESDIRRLIQEYLSAFEGERGFDCGAYVVVRSDRLIIEHDEGWSAVATAGSLPVVLDYSVDGLFAGEAGRIALLEWLQP